MKRDIVLEEGFVLAGRYKIVKKIDEGAYGVVYLAEDTQFGEEKVAVKTLKPDIVGKMPDPVILRDEALKYKKLSHPNIVSFYDFIENEDLSFLVMEYVDGPSLAQLIKEKKSLSEPEFYPIALGLCKALVHSHRKDLIHRDIKPKNILIDKSSNQPKLADFGISQVFSDLTIFKSKKRTSSSNIIRDWRPSDDIYSLGVVFFFMLTGKLPHFDIKPFKAYVIPFFKPSNRISQEINEVIKSSLGYRPENRPSSAEALYKMVYEAGVSDSSRKNDPDFLEARIDIDTLKKAKTIKAYDKDKEYNAAIYGTWGFSILFLLAYFFNIDFPGVGELINAQETYNFLFGPHPFYIPIIFCGYWTSRTKRFEQGLWVFAAIMVVQYAFQVNYFGNSLLDALAEMAFNPFFLIAGWIIGVLKRKLKWHPEA